MVWLKRKIKLEIYDDSLWIHLKRNEYWFYLDGRFEGQSRFSRDANDPFYNEHYL